MRELALSNSDKVALVDDEDYQRAFENGPWILQQEGSREVAAKNISVDHKRTRIYLHRFLQNTDKRFMYKFSDGNGLNVQKDNFFVVNGSTIDENKGKFFVCKKCGGNKPHSDYRYRNVPENRKTYRRLECRMCEQEKEKTTRPPRCPRKMRETSLKKLYGISIEDWEYIFEKQNQKCAICQTNVPSGTGWCTDHDHATEKIRGILCTHCNTMLGHAKDNKKTLRKAVVYLTEFEELNSILEVI